MLLFLFFFAIFPGFIGVRLSLDLAGPLGSLILAAKLVFAGSRGSHGSRWHYILALAGSVSLGQ